MQKIWFSEHDFYRFLSIFSEIVLWPQRRAYLCIAATDIVSLQIIGFLEHASELRGLQEASRRGQEAGRSVQESPKRLQDASGPLQQFPWRLQEARRRSHGGPGGC